MPDVAAYKAAMKLLYGCAPDEARRKAAADQERREAEAKRAAEMRTGPRKQATHRAMIDALLSAGGSGLATSWPGWEDTAQTDAQREAVRLYRQAAISWEQCPADE